MAKQQTPKVQNEKSDDQIQEKMITVNRVTKVVKGGRVMSFSALTVVGDGDGGIGMGKGKAKEVPVAVQKAMGNARKSLWKVPLDKGTFSHHVQGKHGASSIMFMPAKPGTGIIAGGPMRAIFEMMGVKDVVAKSNGSNNSHNIVRATLKALAKVRTASYIAAKRGKIVKEIFN